MSYSFGRNSENNLIDCDPAIIQICRTAILVVDFSVLDGYRNKGTQDFYFKTGRSQKKWSDSWHNTYPSKAVDIAPYPLDWEDRERFVFLAGVMFGIGESIGYPLTWGGDWDNDRIFNDQHFYDLVHFQHREF